MIKPVMGKSNKVLVLFDAPPTITKNRISTIISDYPLVVTNFRGAQIDITEVTRQCICDSVEPKLAEYKKKAAHIKDLVELLAPNVIVLTSAKVHEWYTGVKGASKYYGRVWTTEGSKQKLITLPTLSACVYNPDLKEVIKDTLELIKTEMEFPEIRGASTEESTYVLVDTIEKVREWWACYKNVKRFAVDLETTGLQFNKHDILTIQFSEGAGKGWCIPTPQYTGTWTPEEWQKILLAIKRIIEDDNREKIGANVYFDLKFMSHKYGFKLPRENVTDILINSFLTDENRGDEYGMGRAKHNLKDLAAMYVKGAGDYELPLDTFKDAYCKQNKIKKSDFTYDLVPADILFQYGCMDVDYSYQLADYFAAELVKEKQVQVSRDVHRYAWALAQTEMSGWALDVEGLLAYKEDLIVRIAALKEVLISLPNIKKAVRKIEKEKLTRENEKRVTKLTELKTPVEFLVSSSTHKTILFRDILNFPEIKKTKKGAYSTDKDCFAAWAELHPDVEEIRCIKQIEELAKMLSTYVIGILDKQVNGRIHCSYRVCGCSTGRISSASPNLQNVSQRSAEAAILKKCFIAKPGHTLIACDLSNAELRVTAAISKDPVMTASFLAGNDPHSSTAKAVFNLECEVSEVKELHNDMRQRAKTLNFAALYGSTPMSIAESLKISEEAAAQMLDDYFTKHAGVKEMFAENSRSAHTLGYVEYPNGRRRRVPALLGNDIAAYKKERFIRQVNNAVIQGCSSDIALTALANMWAEIEEKKLPYRIINIIHDSIEMEVPDNTVEDALEFIVRNMSTWGNYLSAPFPMKADAEVGKTWADLKEPEVFLASGEEDEEEYQEAA